MVHHIILWKINSEKTEAEKLEIKKNVKNGLEGLSGKIDGLIDISVRTKSLESSTADIMLDSVFTDPAALKAYSTNPLHVKVANTFVRPNMEIRMCMDFED